MAEALRECQRLALAGQFAASIMHEINGPLEAIANLNYLIQNNLEEVDKVGQYSRLLDEQLRVLITIAHQTLGFYHASEAKEAIRIGSLIEAALRIHRHKLAAKATQLVKQLPDNVVVEGNPGAMLQVVSNLIGNALEALPPDGKLQLRARCSGGQAHIVVADNGHGIPAPIQRRIFEPFFSTKGERGTGLGLAICKAIVEGHGGRIYSRTSTRDGKSGTAFRVSLPMSRK